MVIVLALLGLIASELILTATGVNAHQIEISGIYGKGVTALLAVGLFASVYGISLHELRRNARVVVVAITFGVALKALLTGGIMVLAYGGAGYLLLGVAVAQIDPLSVTASLSDSGMSRRAKSVLSAWASFDDPVTVLLVAYLASATLPAVRQHGGGTLTGVGTGSFLVQVGLNVALVAVAGVAWYLLAVRAGLDRTGRGNAVICLFLVVLMALAVSRGLLVGITVCGLFFRPKIEQVISRVVGLAFYAATFLLGMLLVTGVDLPAGLLLGASVYTVQILAGSLISRDMPRRDRVHLALGQQNGLTAIVLALALQPYFPAAVGVISVAILVVNILHICSNSIAELVIHPVPPAPPGPRSRSVPSRYGERMAGSELARESLRPGNSVPS